MKIQQSEIDSILQQEDIEGFIEFGAPSDEYSSEAEYISSALVELAPEKFDEENIAAIVSLIWMKSFNLPDREMSRRMPAIRRLAQRILAIQRVTR